ncbi:hypothetical protein L226DRAFT_536186 [Lentinus tigrinus ALCF2SS1-7]|uniref:ABM domain-containing protein n=1 Tax=Lentinus tigrinus ALCF2SS1-6 TaxID=1328759 RepID=A0A5C2S671_9APHY|nr:hypothetical protein L227DRAFT_527763 [Lentinus tigrinus ALCF2SS1-6]RPD73505.1 hypothetical protein L226DRAFT_536186 [Lentinus tigrinus ALCF2SS1-7]
MGNPTVEFAYAPATEIMRQDPHNEGALAETISILKAQDGVIKIYNGLQHEDKATTYLLVVWESYEHHEKLMKDEVTYPILGSALSSVLDLSKISLLHVKPTNEPYKAFEAPVLEIVTYTLHDGQSKTKLEGLVDKLANHLTNTAKSSTEVANVFHTSWGPTREKDNVLVLFIGWPSIEAHLDLVKNDPGAIDIIGQCKAISDVDVIHVPLALC